MYKLVKKKVEATFPKPKAPGKDPAKHVVDEHRELMKRKLDKEDKHNEDKANEVVQDHHDPMFARDEG